MTRVLLTALTLLLLGSVASVDAAGGATPSDIMERAEQRFRTLTDYECTIDCESRLGGAVERGTYRIWFRQPNLLRVRVVKGQRRGSEVAMDEKGQFRGREGGLLKPIVVRLKPSDRRLQSIRGKCVTEFNLNAFYQRYRERCAQPGVTAQLIPPAVQGPYTVALTFSQDGKKMRELYRIDADAWTLTGGEVYEDGTLVEQFTVRELRVDTGLKENWFRL
jgi:hypothetical protein